MDIARNLGRQPRAATGGARRSRGRRRRRPRRRGCRYAGVGGLARRSCTFIIARDRRCYGRPTIVCTQRACSSVRCPNAHAKSQETQLVDLACLARNQRRQARRCGARVDRAGHADRRSEHIVNAFLVDCRRTGQPVRHDARGAANKSVLQARADVTAERRRNALSVFVVAFIRFGRAESSHLRAFARGRVMPARAFGVVALSSRRPGLSPAYESRCSAAFSLRDTGAQIALITGHGRDPELGQGLFFAIAGYASRCTSSSPRCRPAKFPTSCNGAGSPHRGGDRSLARVHDRCHPAAGTHRCARVPRVPAPHRRHSRSSLGAGAGARNVVSPSGPHRQPTA